MRYLIFFWIFVILASFFSAGVSSITHSIIGIPQGVPLARLGIIGGVAQISLKILPFILAPVLTGWVYYKRKRRLVSVAETRHLTVVVACSTIVLFSLFWVGTGAWFVFIQAALWMIFLVLIAPPVIVTVLFRVLFPIAVRMFVSHAELSSRKDEEAYETMADGVWKLFEEGHDAREIAKRVGLGCASINRIIDKKRKP